MGMLPGRWDCPGRHIRGVSLGSKPPLTATAASTLGAGSLYLLSDLCVGHPGWPWVLSFSWLSFCSPCWLLPGGLLSSEGTPGL